MGSVTAKYYQAATGLSFQSTGVTVVEIGPLPQRNAIVRSHMKQWMVDVSLENGLCNSTT